MKARILLLKGLTEQKSLNPKCPQTMYEKDNRDTQAIQEVIVKQTQSGRTILQLLLFIFYIHIFPPEKVAMSSGVEAARML